MNVHRFSLGALGVSAVAFALAACSSNASERSERLTSTSASALSTSWSQVSSTPSSPAITKLAVSDGVAWGIGTELVPGSQDFKIYRRVSGTWLQVAGGAQQIAVSPTTGRPWVVNHDGTVYVGDGTGSSWTAIVTDNPTPMTEIAVGAPSTPGEAIYAVSKVADGPDFRIYQLITSSSPMHWVQEPGGGQHVAVETGTAIPWMSNRAGAVFMGHPGAAGQPVWWEPKTTSPAVTRIAAGPPDFHGATVWAISTDVSFPYSNGTDFGIYQLVNGQWQEQPGGADDIAVDGIAYGIPWVSNHVGTVYEGACDASSCNPAGGSCGPSGETTVCQPGCENMPPPDGCTASVPTPINGIGMILVRCPGVQGNGYYTIDFTADSSSPFPTWIPYSPYSKGSYQYPLEGVPLSFDVDEDDAYLPGPQCQYYGQCTIHATLVRICGVPGANGLTEQNGTCGGPTNECVIVPVTYP